MSEDRMIRVDNLKKIMKARSMSNADLQALLVVSHTMVTKILSNKPGTFGEKQARKIEEALKPKLPRGWLDQVHDDVEYTEDSLAEIAQMHRTAGERAGNYAVTPIPGTHQVAKPSGTLIPVITRENSYMLPMDNRSPEVRALEHLPAEGEDGPLIKWYIVDDRANEPTLPRGSRLKVDADTKKRPPEPGNYVVVRTGGGSYLVRRYTLISEEHYLAEASNSSFAALDSKRDGLTVVAVVIAAYINLV